jgi:hypothetical protein
MPSRACSPNSPASGLKRGVFTSIVDLQAATDRFIARISRAPTAFCACELRSPAQFTDAGFVAFNRPMLSGWPPGGSSTTISIRSPARMSARKSTPPTTPSFYAFKLHRAG